MTPTTVPKMGIASRTSTHLNGPINSRVGWKLISPQRLARHPSRDAELIQFGSLYGGELA